MLWRHEQDAGRQEAAKDRPCAIVLLRRQAGVDTIVTVAPLTHRPPRDPAVAIEVPLAVQRHLGLDTQRSWIICDEVNEFAWPGFDLRLIPGKQGRYDHGFLPPRLFRQVAARVAELARRRQGRTTARG